jgi:DNA-directed RNA polymerase subunit RPC12/RpoP
VTHRCDGCGETFATLSRKRLHDCPAAGPFAGEEPAETHDVADLELDDMADLAVERALTCNYCGETNEEARDVDSSYNENGVSIAIVYECVECGATNENTATFTP